jgi:hypothetical protein
MNELLKKKMEIAKRAGELEKSIIGLSELAGRIEEKKGRSDSLTIQIHHYTDKSHTLRSFEIEGHDGTMLHDSVMGYLKSQIDKRTAELNELIKVLQ